MDDKGEANQLFHEIEYYDESYGELVAWVNIPYLSASVDTVFYMYYGNPFCDSQQYPMFVWDDNYCSVWHLDDLTDSSNNGNDGNNHGTDIISGKIGNARNFIRGQKDYIDWGDMPEPANGNINEATFELWFNPADIDSGNPLINKFNSGDYEPDRSSYVVAASDGFIACVVYSGTWYPEGKWIKNQADEPVVITDYWQHIAVVVDLSVKNIDIYYNGIELDSTRTIQGSPPAYFYDISLSERTGRVTYEGPTRHFLDGTIDELRISKTLRSSDWILTEYNNQNDPSGFMSFGSEEAVPPDAPYIIGPTTGEPGIGYNFTFIAFNPTGQDVFFWIEWGDGIVLKWLGPYDSGESLIISHTWSKKADYIIKAKAKNTYDIEGNWSTFDISIPRTRAAFSSFWLRFFDMFPMLQKILNYIL